VAVRKKKQTLAEVLYEAYRWSLSSELPPWIEILPAERERWERVADAAQDWAYENIQSLL